MQRYISFGLKVHHKDIPLVDTGDGLLLIKKVLNIIFVMTVTGTVSISMYQYNVTGHLYHRTYLAVLLRLECVYSYSSLDMNMNH